MIVCATGKEIKIVTKRKRKKNCVEVVGFYSLRSPLRFFLSFLARASLSASNRVLLQASHLSVLVANLV